MGVTSKDEKIWLFVPSTDTKPLSVRIALVMSIPKAQKITNNCKIQSF